MSYRHKEIIKGAAMLSLFVALAFTLVIACSGCAAPTAKKTHDATAKLQAQLDAIQQANEDLQTRVAAIEKANDDAHQKALDAQKNLEAAKAFLITAWTTVEQYAHAIAQAVPAIDAAHADVVAIVADTQAVKSATGSATKDTATVATANASAGSTIPVINKNADDLQTYGDREHNTWGNKIERFIKGIFFWVILPGVVIAAIVGTVLSSGPGGLTVIGKVAGGIGHGVLLFFTAGIPHLVHAVIAVGVRIGHMHLQKIVVKNQTSNTPT